MLSTSPPDPNLIKDLATRFMASKLLFAAGELGLFEALGQGPADRDTLATKLGLPVRSVALLADAMASVGLIVRDGERYANSPTADTFLAGKTPSDLRPLLRMFERLEYNAWGHLVPTLQAGLPPALAVPLDEQSLGVFHDGIDVFTQGAARGLLRAYDFGGRRMVLDVGGGNGSFLQILLGAHPHLRGTLVELPHVVDVARQKLAGSPLLDRVSLVDADALADDLPLGHDVIIVANVIHLLAPTHTELLLRRLRAIAGEETELLLIDLWTDPPRAEPALAILMAGEFMIRSNFGDVYPAEQGRAWLEASGWQMVEQRRLGEPLSMLVARPA